VTDLAALAATVQGELQGHGQVSGRTDDLAVTAELAGTVATAQVPRGPITLTLNATGLPNRPSGRVSAQGTLDGAPLALDASAERAADGALRFTITHAEWKSAHAEGSGTLAPHATLPAGTIALRIGRLDELRHLVGQPLTGSLGATASLGEQDGHGIARLRAELKGAGLAGTATVEAATLDASIRDPATDPDATATLELTGMRAGAIAGTARLAASGRQAALGLRLTAALSGIAGAELQASSAATLDLPASRVTLSALQASWKGETLRLLAPAHLGFAPAVTVDQMRLAAAGAELDVAGRLAPTLDATVALRNVRAELARIVAPDLRAAGVLNAEARLAGTAARPTGTARLAASGLRMLAGPAGSLPAASLTVTAKLAGATADIEARAAAGANRLELSGTVPVAAGAALRLRGQGNLDLALLNPVLEAQGRRVLGRATLDATVTGTPAAPRATGALHLVNADVQDFVFGAHVTNIAATLAANGDTIRIAAFTAAAGQGRIGARGTVGLGGEMPVDLALTARNATPLASDRLTATLDADLTLRGALQGRLAAGGSLTVNHAEIRIPDKLPASVPVLKVRLPGQQPAPPPAAPPAIGLDVTVAAPGQVFIRGRGLFAEMAGRIHVGGSAAAPVPTGAFRLVRGQFDLVGTTLTFTSGEIRFLGGGTLDPALNLVASSGNGTITATLTVGGFASAPKITLSSTPPLPQDEILAQLLFHQSSNSLSPLQLASIAAALAQISGVGGGVFEPLEAVRQGLGLDRLTVSGGGAGLGPALEAGRYVARGVYVGAKQSASGQGTQATVQIDLLRGLKLETDIGTGNAVSATGAASTTDQYGTVDPYGTSIGLTYQFQY
jgi:translocation and assembly module TamB